MPRTILCLAVSILIIALLSAPSANASPASAPFLAVRGQIGPEAEPHGLAAHGCDDRPMLAVNGSGIQPLSGLPLRVGPEMELGSLAVTASVRRSPLVLPACIGPVMEPGG